LVFIGANGVLTYLGYWQLNILPFVLLLLAATIWSLEKGFLLVVLLAPVSIPLSEFYASLGYNLSIPAEPLLICILVLVIFKSVHENFIPATLATHPLTLLILFHLLWILVTSMASTMPVVSFKFFAARLWFITGFYVLGVLVFQNYKRIRDYFHFYMFGMMVVAGYVLYNHIVRGFLNQEAAHGVSNPFFNDHTSFGAALAMLLPPSFVFSIHAKGWKRIFWGIMTALLLGTFIFSYSRAAWLSMLIAVFVFIIIKLKVRFSIILSISILLALSLLFYWPQVQMRFEQNRQDSSASLAQHVQSISNISSDASNLERINRWKSALRMFEERPVLGWGPGTYMFQYASWQYSQDRTIISTNFGDQGNAHSEYLGPLAESGILGMVSIILIMSYGLYIGFRHYKHRSKTLDNQLLLAVCLGLITYVSHGFLNNFLDTDKASALFWGYLAIIVAHDLRVKCTFNESPPPGTGS